jgi:hypothetical protein
MDAGLMGRASEKKRDEARGRIEQQSRGRFRRRLPCALIRPNKTLSALR